MISVKGSEDDIQHRLSNVRQSYKMLTNKWKCVLIRKVTKVQIFNSIVKEVFLHGNEA